MSKSTNKIRDILKAADFIIVRSLFAFEPWFISMSWNYDFVPS